MRKTSELMVELAEELKQRDRAIEIWQKWSETYQNERNALQAEVYDLKAELRKKEAELAELRKEVR